MRKVYCKNCKWSEERGYFDYGRKHWDWFCKLKDKITIDCIGDRITDFRESFCEKVNEKFDCKHYKRKWWKFWIKNEKDLRWKKYRDNLPLRGPTL